MKKNFYNLTAILFLSLPVPGNAAGVFSDIDKSKWKTQGFAFDTSPVDLRFLNHKPAGKFGPVRSKGDQLVFANGQQARFWGVNIQAAALFQTDSAVITQQALRLAKLGINLVRFHHHDSDWVKPNVFDAQSDNTRTLNPDSMKKLDEWITALRNEGIYIWLDLHTGRTLRKGDQITAYEETKGKVAAFCYLNNSIQARMMEFQQRYLSHKNTLTGIQYKNDPAIVGLLITNENTFSHNGGNRFLRDKNVPQHHALFNADRRAMTKRTGLSYRKTYKTWQPGESKIYLSDVEHRFNHQLLNNLRNLGVTTPVATTNFWDVPAYALPALTDGDIIDVHVYGQGNELNRNPRRKHSFLTQAALGAVAGKPVTLSEWNVASDGVRDRFYMPLYTAAISSLQGWDAAMIYGYSQDPIHPSVRVRNWSSYNDPALMGMMPAAALLYRQQHVAPANKTYFLAFNRDTLFYKNYKGATSKSARTLLEQHRLTVGMPEIKELPWLTPTPVPDDATLITDLNQDFIPRGQSFVESDTKELKRDWINGIHTINTKRTQSASGWIGGHTIALDDVTVLTDTSNALVVVQSMDNKAISETNKLLITLSAQVLTEQKGKTPLWSEPVTGTISINSHAGKTLYSLSADGKKTVVPGVVYSQGKYIITLTEDLYSHWLVLTSQPDKTDALPAMQSATLSTFTIKAQP